MSEIFSRRHGYTGQPRPITIREDAPENLRWLVLEKAQELGLRPYPLRDIACTVLRRRPDPDNWSEYPNVAHEAEGLVYDCEWFKFYDILEEICAFFKRHDDKPENISTEEWPKLSSFTAATNEFMVEEGIGWQLVNGQLTTRGEEAFEAAVDTARAELEEAGRPTAARRINEALRDLSRRPNPDYAGAISHALSALEAAAKDATGQHTLTLGQLIAQGRLTALVPFESVRESIKYAWKYANEEGARHGREGSEPGREEAELIVGLTASVATYLNRRAG